MNPLTAEVEVLRRSPLFRGVEPSRLKLLAFTSDMTRFAPGETLFRQGDTSDSAYVILAGEAVVLAASAIGDIELAGLGEHEVIGEVGILCDVPRTATVKAVTELKTLRIGRECLAEMLETFPSMAHAMLKELALRLSRTSAELALSCAGMAGDAP